MSENLHIRLFYQGPDGDILERKWGNGSWKDVSGQPWTAMPTTPLAAVSWDSGNQTRLFYFDSDRKLQVQHRQQLDGPWKLGGIGALNVQGAPNTSLTVVRSHDSGTIRLRVYCQDAGSNSIQEFAYNNPTVGWVRREAAVPSALRGTGIAATLYETA